MIYSTEYYSAIEKNAIMDYTGKWMDLEKIILNEAMQTQKDKSHMFSLTGGSQLQMFKCGYIS